MIFVKKNYMKNIIFKMPNNAFFALYVHRTPNYVR